MNIAKPVTVTVTIITILSLALFLLNLAVPLGGLVVGVLAFSYAYLPLPAIAVWSAIYGESKKLVGSVLSLIVGLLGLYFILSMIAAESIEVIGETTITRHAGPSLNQEADVDSYIFPVIVMAVAIKLYWRVLAKVIKKDES